MDERFFVRPLVRFGPGKVCSMSHCYVLLNGEDGVMLTFLRI